MLLRSAYCSSSRFIRQVSHSITKLPNRKMNQQTVGLPLSDVVQRLEKFAPSWLAEPWDNVGLLLEPCEGTQVKSVLLTNDLTEDVMDEAVSLGVQMIISYHPPVFKPLKTITNKHWKTRIVSKCLGKSIAVYSPHTSYDSISGGVNDWLAGAFDIASKKPITPAPQPPGPSNLILEQCGAGRHLSLMKPISLKEAVEKVKSRVNAKHVHLAMARGANLETEVCTVALCAGSGGSVLAGYKADLLLTGEMSHHEVLEAVHQGSSVILTWHSTSERGFLTHLAQQLATDVLANNIEVKVSQKDTEPIVTL